MFGERLHPNLENRSMFLLSASMTIACGLVLVAGGPHWFPAGQSAAIRMLGAALAASGFLLAGFGSLEFTLTRRGLAGFSAALFTLVVTASVESKSIWGPAAGRTAEILASLVLVFLALVVSPTAKRARGVIAIRSLFNSDPGERTIRSRYERQIREAAGQEERNRLARDLHDSIKQQIFSIHTAAATAEARFENDREGTLHAIHEVRNAARDAMAEMEAMLDQMRASAIENSGLVESLKRQAEALRHRTGAEIDLRLETMPPNEQMLPGSQQAILRVAQEALANIARHARASKVSLHLGSAAYSVRLFVRDNGAGFDTSTAAFGMGIRNMRERASEFGGTLEVNSSPQGGTLITFSIPTRKPFDEADYRSTAAAWLVLLCMQLTGPSRTSPLAIGLSATAAVGIVRCLIAMRRARRNGSLQ